MTQGKAAKGLDFGALRRGIERSDPDFLLGFYADDAELNIVNAEATHASPLGLCGKAEIAKYLRAVFGQEATHRVERGVVGEDRVTFREACEYPDGGRVWVATTLEVRKDKIVRQVDVVSAGTQADRGGENSQIQPTRQTSLAADTPPPYRLLRSEQATEKEELR